MLFITKFDKIRQRCGGKVRDISEYKLLGNYLIKLYENYGVDSIGYEQAHSLTEKLFTNDFIKVNYRLLPFEEKTVSLKT